jgi:hypothetical protein
MPAGIGGGGYLMFAFETTMGTYVQPNAAGAVAVPILNESLQYTEDKYLSEAIKQNVTIHTDAKPSYYHIEGDVEFEVDPRYLPYWLYITRHLITKTGSGPYVYEFTPSAAGSASTAATGAVARTASLSVFRNNEGFGYAGCVAGSISFEVRDGVLIGTVGVLGLSEVEPTDPGTPAWPDSNLYGADDIAIFLADAGATPTFTTYDINFNGFTLNLDFNAEAQNRIRPDRSASYISFGITDATFDTELDFIDRTDYDNFKATNDRAIRLQALHPGNAASFAAATDGVQLDANRYIYETYEMGLGGMGDLIMAGTTGRILGQAGAAPYTLRVKSATNIS